LKALIADDHAIVRRGVREVLEEAWPGIFVGEAGSVADVLKALQQNTYDMVLLDISFPDGSGLEVLQRIHSQAAPPPVLLLSMYPEEQYALRCLHLGAAGYLTKDSTSGELVNAVQRVMKGGRYITQTLAERLVDEIGMPDEKASHEALSDREFLVLTRLGSGKSIHDIAGELFLSPKTISTYRARFLKKLKLKTEADITRYVIENRLNG
jgi:two-component system invasion response regulator UvrY